MTEPHWVSQEFRELDDELAAAVELPPVDSVIRQAGRTARASPTTRRARDRRAATVPGGTCSRAATSTTGTPAMSTRTTARRSGSCSLPSASSIARVRGSPPSTSARRRRPGAIRATVRRQLRMVERTATRRTQPVGSVDAPICAHRRQARE